MAVNKVVYGTTVLVDLTEDTVTAATLMQGYTAHDKSGALITGTASGGGDASLRELICPQQTVTPSSYEVSLEREEGLVIGGHYVVTYDGTEYLFTAGSLWGGNAICLGESTLNYDHSARNDEIAPFLLWEVFNDVTRTPKLYSKDNNSHTIKVERIDRDSVETANICPQQTVTTNSSRIGTLSNTTAQLVVGDYYLVTYDGTEWMLTAASLWEGDTIGVGDDMVIFNTNADDSVYPFFLFNNGTGMGFYALDASASHTVKVDRITEIPDSIALTTKTITSNGTYNASSDNANGYSSVTVNVPTGGGNDFIITASWDSVNSKWVLDKTFAEISAAHYAGKTIAVVGADYGTADGTYIEDSPNDFFAWWVMQQNGDDLDYWSHMTDTHGTTLGFNDTFIYPNFTSPTRTYTPTESQQTDTITFDPNNYNGIQQVNVTVNPIPSQYIIPSGNKSITQNGSNIDVAEYATVSVNVPTGGSSMNVQTAQSTTRVANTAYTKTASLICSKSGTYDVYWDCFRSTTSGTSGSQLYIGGTASGSANTTFSNHAQNNHRTGVQINANQEVAVYVRSRATNYYAYCGQLTIVQTA